MDDQQFDRLALQLTRMAPRRHVIVTLAAIIVGGVAGWPSRDIAARRRQRRRRCNPPCPACQVCNTRRGRCVARSDGESCGECRSCQAGQCRAASEGAACGECHICRAGTCVNVADGTGCAECLVCDGGACSQVAPDATPCRGDGQCGSGRCFSPPSCDPALALGCNPVTGAPCCSGTCFTLGGPSICLTSGLGDQCLTTADCGPGLTCRVFLCG